MTEEGNYVLRVTTALYTIHDVSALDSCCFQVTIVQGNVVEHPKTAEVLVEIKPFQYILKGIEINQDRVYPRERSITLVKRKYVNDSPKAKLIRDEIDYEVQTTPFSVLNCKS